MTGGVTRSLLDPGHLDRLEDLFAAAARVVRESGQRLDPRVQVGEAHLEGIDVRMRLGERDGDVARVGPFHDDLRS